MTESILYLALTLTSTLFVASGDILSGNEASDESVLVMDYGPVLEREIDKDDNALLSEPTVCVFLCDYFPVQTPPLSARLPALEQPAIRDPPVLLS